MNRVEIIGRLTKDPELRYTTNNKAVAIFTIAINRQFKNENGEYDADFISCKAFNKRAETISKYCKKGDLLGIEGSIRTGSYEKDDKKVYTTEIVADNVHFLSPSTNTPKNEKQAEKGTENVSEYPLNEKVFEDFGNHPEITDDDIAF